MPATILLQLTNKGVFYHPEHAIPLERTNLPVGGFTFKTHYPIFWLAEQTAYDPATQTLKIQVVDYHYRKSDGFTEQSPKKPIKNLHFLPLDWEELLPHFSYYQRQQFAGMLLEKEKVKKSPQGFITNFEKPALEETIQFSISINKTTFGMGFVSMERRLKNWNNTASIKVYNDYILPEFDHVKPFFSKVLQTKKLHVEAVVKITHDEIIQVSALSPEIDRIDRDTITGVKHLHLKKMLDSPRIIAVDKSVFTAKDLFDEEERQLGNTLRQSEKELFQNVMEIKGVRNRKQLEYLAGKLQAANEPLRYTLNPNFGFLFFVKGERMHHYVWELLNSHATYLWSFEPAAWPAPKAYAHVQERIQFIRHQGRNAYRQSPNLAPHTHFQIIRHDKANSPLVDGFPLWRSRLEERLV